METIVRHMALVKRHILPEDHSARRCPSASSCARLSAVAPWALSPVRGVSSWHPQHGTASVPGAGARSRRPPLSDAICTARRVLVSRYKPLMFNIRNVVSLFKSFFFRVSREFYGTYFTFFLAILNVFKYCLSMWCMRVSAATRRRPGARPPWASTRSRVRAGPEQREG